MTGSVDEVALWRCADELCALYGDEVLSATVSLMSAWEPDDEQFQAWLPVYDRIRLMCGQIPVVVH